MLVGGGSFAFEKLTGLDKGVASFFIRMFFFSGSGGLISTYCSSYVQAVMVNVFMVVFVIYIFFISPDIGGVDKMYDRLTSIASQSEQDCIDFGYDPSTQTCGGVSGNYQSSYMTIRSLGGLFFGVINVIGNFGAVFVDQTYWQIAISARKDICYQAFIIGGLMWFAIPFCLGSAMGLANVALQLPTNFVEAIEGLVPICTVDSIMGKAGSSILLIQLFMAVSSAGSSELSAIASIFVYDIYRTYLNTRANSAHIKYYSRFCIVCAGAAMGALSVFSQALELSLGWLYLVMGIMIGSAVFPICCCLTWEKASGKAAVCAALGGQGLAVISWLVSTKLLYGDVNLNTTGNNVVMLIGNVVSLSSSVIIMTVMTYIDPQNFDLKTLNSKLTLVKDKEVFDGDVDLVSLLKRAVSAENIVYKTEGLDNAEDGLDRTEDDFELNDTVVGKEPRYFANVTQARESILINLDSSKQNPSFKVEEASKFTKHKSEYAFSFTLVIVLLVIWPSISYPVGDFGRSYFKFWIALIVIWSFIAALVSIALPIYESRKELVKMFRGFLGRRSIFLNDVKDKTNEDFQNPMHGDVELRIAK